MSSTDNLTITKDTPLADCPHKLLELVDNIEMKDGDSKALKESLQVLHKRVTEKETKSIFNQYYKVESLHARYTYVKNCINGGGSLDDNDDADDSCLHIRWTGENHILKLCDRTGKFMAEKLKISTKEQLCDWVRRRPHLWIVAINRHELQFNLSQSIDISYLQNAGDVYKDNEGECNSNLTVTNRFDTIITDIEPVE